MKNLARIVLLTIIIVACEKTPENKMLVSGTISGLKKGTLYLQHIKDSTLATIDSLEIRGDGAFSFSYGIESPELFYLYLKKDDNNDINDRISFFGEKGEITIITTWNTFDSNAKVIGSKSHDDFAECREILSKFNTRDLELAQLSLSPEIQNDSVALDSIQGLSDKNILRRYLYVLNFALNNGNSYISPYLALTEANDANPKYLDSINNALAPEVAGSKYGKQLDVYVNSLKK